MKKGSVVFPAEFLIRLAIGIVFAVLIITIGCKVFKIDTGANAARESFDELVQTIQNLGSVETRAHELVQNIGPRGTAVLGFTKESQKIEFLVPASNPSTIRPVFDRPSSCPSGKACLCYCGKFLPSQTGSSCAAGLSCSPIDGIDFLPLIKMDDFLPKTTISEASDYAFRGGFFIGFLDPPYNLKVNTARIVLSIERKGDIVALCDHQPCIK